MIDNKELAEMLIKIGEDLKLGNDNVRIRSHEIINGRNSTIMSFASIKSSTGHSLTGIINIYHMKKLQE